MHDLFKSEFARTLIEGSILLPSLVVVLYGIAMRRATRASARWGRAVWAPGLLAGGLSGYAAAYRDFSFPPHTVLSWLPWLVVAGAVLVVLGGWSSEKYGLHGARALASAASAFVLLRPVLHQERLLIAAVSWLGVTVVWFLLWVGLVPPRDDQRTAGTALLSTAAGFALVAPLSGSIELARLSASLAVALGGGLLFSLFIVRTRWGSPTADVPILILGALLVDLRFYAGASLVVMRWLIASRGAAWGAIALMRRRALASGWSVIVPGLVTLLPVALAIWTAVRIFRKSGGY